MNGGPGRSTWRKVVPLKLGLKLSQELRHYLGSLGKLLADNNRAILQTIAYDIDMVHTVNS